MKKQMPHAIVAKNLRALGVGGTVGAAAGAALYFMAPAVRRAGISLDTSSALGAAVGTALHHSVLPLLAVLTHYRRMLEIVLARRVGWMTAESAARIMATIQERYFLGSDRGVKTRAPRHPRHPPVPATVRSLPVRDYGRR